MEKKFRYWNGGQMIPHSNIKRIDFCMKCVVYEDVYGFDEEGNISTKTPLLVFTGLKDINGQEIYEGDIITMHKCEYGEYDDFKGVICFDEERVAFTVKDKIYSLYNMNEYNLIRIGSIFEIKECCKISDDLTIDTFNNLLSIKVE